MLLLNCHCVGFHNGWLLPPMLLVQSCMWLSDCDSVPPHHRCESVTPADTHVDAAANVKSGSPTSQWVGEPALGIVRRMRPHFPDPDQVHSAKKTSRTPQSRFCPHLRSLVGFTQSNCFILWVTKRVVYRRLKGWGSDFLKQVIELGFASSI